MLKGFLYHWRTKPTLAGLTHRYDKKAVKWHSFLQQKNYLNCYEQLLKNVFKKYPVKVSGAIQVLDVGAGSGGFSVSLCNVYKKMQRRAQLNFELLDASSAMLNEASLLMSQQPFSFTTNCSDVNALANSDKCYDFILCAHLLEHCAQPLAVLKILCSRLNKHGVLVLVVSKPHWCTVLLQLIWQHRAYSKESFVEALNTVGFNQVTAIEFDQSPPKFTSVGYIAKLN